MTDLTCAFDGCDSTIKNHKWGRIKSNWFQQKDGRVWCPNHTPEWVAAWRKNKIKETTK